ncbi:hypothetical protein J6590_100119, partial [Homalodisca vitripennis]
IPSVQNRFLLMVGKRLDYGYREVPVCLRVSYIELMSLESRRQLQDVLFLFRIVTYLIDYPALLGRSGTRSGELFDRYSDSTNYEMNSTDEQHSGEDSKAGLFCIKASLNTVPSSGVVPNLPVPERPWCKYNRCATAQIPPPPSHRSGMCRELGVLTAAFYCMFPFEADFVLS